MKEPNKFPGTLNILKKAGLKVTPARQIILKVFFDNPLSNHKSSSNRNGSTGCEPLNVEYIYKKLKDQKLNSHKINQATVYRTLASLEDTGILKRVDLRKDSIYYELSESVGDSHHNHHHHHIVCGECGRTERFDICVVDKISKEVVKKSSIFESVSQHSLELFGLCKSCVGR